MPVASARKSANLSFKLSCRILFSLLFIIVASCNEQTLASFVDSSQLKPSIILILPQSFRVPINQQVDEKNLESYQQQYVAVINNVRNDQDDQIIRQQFKKLSLQVRDAKSPITGQLFFEHLFDYFPTQQHLVIPIDLSQVSPYQESQSEHGSERRLFGPILRYINHTTPSPPAVVRQPQQLIVSIRPHNLDSGFGSDSIELVSSGPIPVEVVPGFDGKRSFAVVQTDKPIYKPDDKVRIRSLVVNENLRAVTKDEFKLQIKNPHKIIVEEMRFPNEYTRRASKKASEEGQFYFDHVFSFPPDPMQGIWTAQILHNDPIANDTISFEVREYVLPPFEIQFASPKYILPSAQSISGHVIAKYHYGKPVQGKAQFKFGYQESATARPRFIARTNIKTIDPITGRVDYKIKPEKFRETIWFPEIAGSRFVVEVTVTEMTSGHREVSTDSSCIFITLPYKVSFEDSIENFKPGVAQQLSVQMLDVQSNRPAPVGLPVIAHYTDNNGTLLNLNTNIDPDTPNDFGHSSITQTWTDLHGRATFNLGPVQDNITAIHITIKMLNETIDHDDANKYLSSQSSKMDLQNELAVGHHSLTKHESLNGWISIMNKSMTEINVGDQFVSDLLIRDAIVIPQRIFYIIMIRGQIWSVDTLDSYGMIKFNVTESMMPSIRLVLFALTHDSVGFLSDSMRINVGQDLNCGMNMQFKSMTAMHNNNTSETIRPNDRGQIRIQARQGDSVSLIGTDSAVFTLNNRSKLDSSRIIERIKRLDSGCGFGGGKNHLDVFHNAGLMLYKNPAGENVAESGSNLQLGSLCLTVVNQLKLLEDIQLGYARPVFTAAAQVSRPRALELLTRQKLALHLRQSRAKREVDTELIVRRYKDPLERSCCRLGTLEDLPQRRNCSVRARIVEKYMRQVDFNSCSLIYFECCRAVFGEHLLLGSMVEPIVRPRKGAPVERAPLYTDASMLSNVGHLDRIEQQTLTRNDFRESWLFEVVDIEKADGSATLDVKLPHSITSWSISALALNKYQPMCFMNQPMRLVTFQPIFIQLSMPYKVIQGEQIDLVATIFNYSPNNQEVMVYMYGIEDVCSEAEPGERSARKRIRIERHSSQSVLFPIIPLRVGVYPIKILAITQNSSNSDIIERRLTVVAKGKPVIDETTFSLDPMNQQRRSKRAIQTGNLVDEIDSSRGLQRSRVKLAPTRDSEFIVPQTQECYVSAIGDKMGQTLQTTMIDVENLIRLPHGCGEQVMIYLGPTLYTTRYLSAINKLTGDMRWRAIRYIQSGYKRVLNYRKQNGAFSAFARRDASVWLTAFVAKMLCQTERTPFIAEEVHVDRTLVNTALEWLCDAQDNETGTWTEMNPVYHREMLGGVLKENALTAFVTITLNECAHHSPDLLDEAQVEPDRLSSSNSRLPHAQLNAVDKLKRTTLKAEQALLLDKYRAIKERNPYVAALTAYALSFSRPQDGAEMLTNLLQLADRSQAKNHLFWKGDYQIETAAYALQALIELAPVLTSSPPTNNVRWSPGADAISLSNWLSSRRSYTGAFESTQDTVVALEALSKFAQLQSSPSASWLLLPQSVNLSPSLFCNVTINNRTRRSIEFGKDNAQILQTFRLDSFDLDSLASEVLDIETSGNGLGTMSVRFKYNVFQEEDELCRFNIDSSIEEWKPKINLANIYGAAAHNSSSDVRDANNANETIGDDYFRAFDRSMLSELNLMDSNNRLDGTPISDTAHWSSSATSSKQPRAKQRKEVLRVRRLASDYAQVDSYSSQNNTNSWSSKIVSSLREKLPSWLTPKRLTSTTTTASPLAESTTQMVTSRARINTSRRSTQPSSLPTILQPASTGIPADVKLNPLSARLDSRNETGNGSNVSHSTNATSSYELIGEPDNRLVLLLRVCVHHMSTRRDSEMAVIEVGILSGFKPNEADLKEVIQDVGTPAMYYETSADKSLVVIYMRYIPFTGPHCLQFRLLRESLVYNLQSGYIRAYEYYNPTHSCSNFYTPARQTDLLETRCDSSGQVCQCASKSLCPATNKLMDLGEIHSLNVSRAREKLIDLVCNDSYDLVSLVRLKDVRYLETGRIFKIYVKAKSDLRGNLTRIVEAHKQHKPPTTGSADYSSPVESMHELSSGDEQDSDEQDANSPDKLSLSIDSGCVRNDPFLLHLAHQKQWKQGGELMILFARRNRIELRSRRVTNRRAVDSSRSANAAAAAAQIPKPRAAIFSSASSSWRPEELPVVDEPEQRDFSTLIQLDKDSILYDVAYQSSVEPRATISNLILWLELRLRRERWSCPTGVRARS